LNFVNETVGNVMHVARSLLDARGRLSRRGFWMVYAGYGVYSLIVSSLIMLLSGSSVPPFRAILVGLSPGMLVMAFAAIRRFHDRGHSGWYVAGYFGLPIAAVLLPLVLMELERDGVVAPTIVLGFVPVLLGVAAIAVVWGSVELFFLRGQAGPNRFGPDPLARGGS
jgi:uncharacterized membrane protein YhaH (DUF805 family)